MDIGRCIQKEPENRVRALNSNVILKGAFRKGMCLLIVLVSHHLDLAVGSDFIRNIFVFALISRELISIMENAGLMGIPWPDTIRKALDVLHEKGGPNRTDSTGDDV